MRNFFLLWKMAWRNLWRQKRRSLITVFAMGVGLALCIPTYGLVEGLNQEMVRGITRSHLGHIQVHHPEYLEERRLDLTFPEETVSAILARDPDVLQSSPRVYTGGMVSSEHHFDVRLATLDSAHILISGVRPDGEKTCQALLDQHTAKKWRLDLGSQLRVDPIPPEPACERVEISGIIQTPESEGAQLSMLSGEVAALLQPRAAHPEKLPDLEDLDSLESLEPQAGNDQEVAADILSPPTLNPPSLQSASQSGTLRVLRSASSQVGIIAVDPARESMVTSMVEKVQEGSYLDNAYRNASGRPQILIGAQLARILMVQPGDILGLDIFTRDGFAMDDLVEVAGIFRSGMDSMDRTLTFVHLQMAWDPDLMNLRDPGTGVPQVHEMAVRVPDDRDNVRIAERLQTALADAGLQVWPWQKVEPSLASLMKMQDAVVAIMLLIIFSIAALGTMNTMLMSVFERIREFGVLKSVGMRPSHVAFLILMETSLLTLVSMTIGGLLGGYLNWHLTIHGLDLSGFLPDGYTYQGLVINPVWRAAFTVKSLLVPLVLMTAVSLVVAIWPALRAARIRPVEALRRTGV